RAYVEHDGDRVAWFFGTTLATPFVVVPQLVWKMPWHWARMRLAASWVGERCDAYRLSTRARWGAAELVAQGSDEPTGRLDGFTDTAETARVLTHPTVAYYRRRDGDVATYGIWHAPLAMQRARADRCRFRVFEDLGLVRPGAAPHSVLLQRETD